MNAIKFSYQGDFVEITSKEECDTILVTVSDHGIGMGPIMIENLFKPGSTIRQTGTDNEKGTGLALIIVKEFIDRLGYSIQVESEEGKGATFTILIPRTNGK
jgi:signal transduction histidine kinase